MSAWRLDLNSDQNDSTLKSDPTRLFVARQKHCIMSRRAGGRRWSAGAGAVAGLPRGFGAHCRRPGAGQGGGRRPCCQVGPAVCEHVYLQVNNYVPAVDRHPFQLYNCSDTAERSNAEVDGVGFTISRVPEQMHCIHRSLASAARILVNPVHVAHQRTLSTRRSGWGCIWGTNHL